MPAREADREGDGDRGQTQRDSREPDERRNPGTHRTRWRIHVSLNETCLMWVWCHE